MKMQLLSSDSIRIVLTFEEMQELDMDWTDFDYNDTKSRRIIWELFDRAREETGFDASTDRLLIKLFPKRNGGCELLVSKLSDTDSGEEEGRAFIFESADDLLCFRRHLSTEHLSLWEHCKPLGNGRFCLVFKRVPICLKRLLTEFAAPADGKYIEYHLKELEE